MQSGLKDSGDTTEMLAGHRLIVSSNPTPVRLWRRPRGLVWDSIPESRELMVEYIIPEFYVVIGR